MVVYSTVKHFSIISNYPRVKHFVGSSTKQKLLPIGSIVILPLLIIILRFDEDWFNSLTLSSNFTPSFKWKVGISAKILGVFTITEINY